MTRLFVGNVPSDVREDDLRKEFSHYGRVVGVDLKEKRTVDDVNKFAFVTVEADKFGIEKCIREFSEERYRGNRLKISIAKESFMDRLKRERAEAEKSKPKEPVKVNGSTTPNESIKIKTDDSTARDESEKINDSTARDEPKDVKAKTSVRKPFWREKTKKSENNKRAREEDDSDEAPVAKKQTPRRPVTNAKNETNGTTPLVQKNTEVVDVSDRKRLESIQNMKAAYNEKKSLIRMALSSVDGNRNNKIVFDEDDAGVLISNDPRNGSNEEKPAKRSKTKLFDEDSEDDDKYNFEIKRQFEGESGRKLLDLRSRYGSDNRFVLDERFKEDGDEEEEEEEEVTVRRPSAENDKDEKESDDEIDAVDEDEKTRQMQILQGIIGDSKIVIGKSDNAKKLPPKTMLRFDPSRPDHTKFLNKPAEKPPAPKKTKKDKKKEEEARNEKSRPEEAPAPVVSQERYYRVNETLKKSMEDKQPFSLLTLFGNKEDGETETGLNNDDEYVAKPIEKQSKKIKNPFGDEKNPFFYDTSDSEDEKNTTDKKKTDSVAPVNKDVSDKPAIILENFFFSNDDQRLIEGLQFFLNPKSTTERSRHELKSVIQKRIHNNFRNSKFRPKKISKSSRNNNVKRFQKR